MSNSLNLSPASLVIQDDVSTERVSEYCSVLGDAPLYLGARKQRGSVLLVVIFVIVVMSLLAAGVTRIGVSSQDTTTVEVLGARAWFAAHSGNEVAMSLLFPVGSDIANTALCPSASQTPVVVNISGLPGCSVSVVCSQYVVTAPSSKYFVLESTGTCGSSDHRVSRVQELMAKELSQ